jgi:hypothetical protein
MESALLERDLVMVRAMFREFVCLSLLNTTAYSRYSSGISFKSTDPSMGSVGVVDTEPISWVSVRERVGLIGRRFVWRGGRSGCADDSGYRWSLQSAPLVWPSIWLLAYYGIRTVGNGRLGRRCVDCWYRRTLLGAQRPGVDLEFA